jgi:hypothetical protein
VRLQIRIPIVAAFAIAITGLLPASAAAAPRDDSCAAYRALPFAVAVPADMRTVGTHQFERLATFVDPDGTVGSVVTQNEITISAGADRYPNTVLLRIFRNTTLLQDFSVIDVDTMRPDQDALFYSFAFSIAGDDQFFGTFRQFIHYETSPGVWTPYVEIVPGPLVSLCTQDRVADWKRSRGWD